jgi:hypothetical protein
MPDYRVYALNKAGRIAGAPTVITCDEDQAAIEAAKLLIAEQEIEVWEGARIVARIEPDKVA